MAVGVATRVAIVVAIVTVAGVAAITFTMLGDDAATSPVAGPAGSEDCPASFRADHIIADLLPHDLEVGDPAPRSMDGALAAYGLESSEMEVLLVPGRYEVVVALPHRDHGRIRSAVLTMFKGVPDSEGAEAFWAISTASFTCAP